MKIVSIQEILEVNRLIQETGLPYKIHMRDACGQQSFWIEPLGSEMEQSEKLYELLNDYFVKNRMNVVLMDNKLSFLIQ